MVIGLLHKALFPQSKPLLSFLLLLLVLASPHSKTLMPTMWHAFTSFFEGAPAFAFFLLNCLILTIAASSKLERQKGAQEEELSKGESMSQAVAKADEKRAFIVENVVRRGIIAGQSQNSSITKGYNYHMEEGIKDFVGSGCSCSDFIVEKKLSIGSLFFDNDRGDSHAKPSLQKPHDTTVDEKVIKGHGRAGNITDHLSPQAEEPAAAAIACSMLTKKSDDGMAHTQAPDHLSKGLTDGKFNQALEAASARSPPGAVATDAHSQPAAAIPEASAAVALLLRAAEAAAPRPNPPSAAVEKHEDANDYEDDSELEELNRRAEEFIARFHHQMRLQHQESLQSCPCNYDIQYSNHMQLPGPGLLVG